MPYTVLDTNLTFVVPLGLEYIFGHLSGSLLTSSLVLIVYCAVKRCQITVSGSLVGHALCAGVMWGLGLGERVFKIKEKNVTIVSVSLLSTNDILGFGIGLPVTLAVSWIVIKVIIIIYYIIL